MRDLTLTYRSVDGDGKGAEKQQYDILVYGDSNSWGMPHDPRIQERYKNPWPRLLQKKINEANIPLQVQSNCLCSRTTVHDALDTEWIKTTDASTFNGKKYLTGIFNQHSPRWLIVFLGTNDLRNRDPRLNEFGTKGTRLSKDAATIASNVMEIVEHAIEMWENDQYHTNSSSKEKDGLHVIVINPPLLDFLTAENKIMGYTQESEDISKSFPDAFAFAMSIFAGTMTPKHHLYHVQLIDDTKSFCVSQEGVSRKRKKPDTNVKTVQVNIKMGTDSSGERQSIDGVHINETIHGPLIANAVFDIINEVETPAAATS
jgi:lysophospholipase L1-like esterase